MEKEIKNSKKNANKKNKNVNIEDVSKKIEKKISEKKVNKKKNIEKELIIKETEKEKNGFFEVILISVIIALIFSLIGYFIGKKTNFENGDYSTATKEIQKFIEEYNYVLENYYGEIDKEELISGAIKGMLSSLDEYSQFVDEDSNNFSITLEGEYEGLGVGISLTTENEIIISTIYPNSPAEKAGLKIYDVITKFNDENVEGLTTSDLVDKISNTENIKLTILRGTEELNFELKKEKIVIQSVHSEMEENNIGYIKVDVFANNTYSQFQKALIELENNNMKSLIIDLRGNSGGHLLAVENMLSLFMNDTHVIYQTEDKDGIEKIYSTGNKDKEYNIVILQNSGSASASEVMATSLREQLGAYIIGNTSYGKGTVQNLQTISGIGQYKVTTKKWLTSNGEWINEVGVKPDLEVSLSEDYYKNPILENDDQYQTAIKYLNEKEN